MLQHSHETEVDVFLEFSCFLYDPVNVGDLISGSVDDTSLMAESKEELKSLLMRVKEESETAGLKLNMKKLRSWHAVPSFHGK